MNHLFLEEVKLPASAEWLPPPPGWHFVRAMVGVSYWLGPGVIRELAPGEVVVIPPQAKGGIRASRLGEVCLQSCCFCPEMLAGFLTLAERHRLETALLTCKLEARILPGTHLVGQQFGEVLAQSSVSNQLFRRCKALSMVITYFAEDLAPRPSQGSRPSRALDRDRRFLEQMSDQMILERSTGELASLCGCSRRHFSRRFHQHFGTSIQVQRTALRLTKARRLLAADDAKIIDVALECGYRSLRLFNAMFKKHAGITPSKWRQRNLKKPRPKVQSALVTSNFREAGAVEREALRAAAP